MTSTTSTAPKSRLDLVGIALSGLCLLHCLAIPLVATGALAWAASESIHIGLTVALSVVVVAVAVPSYQRHRRASIPALLVGGIALLVAAVTVGEAMGELAETLLTVAGSIVLIAGHVLNLRLRPVGRPVA
ncbi:MAG: MerC domain-containing protein [Bacteroidota bacterium]